MPGYDGTGPRGMGSMTGRGLGYCVMPIEDSATNRTQYPPKTNIHGAPGRPFGILPYGFNRRGVWPRYFGFGHGRHSGARGCFFGKGRGFGR